MFFKTTLPKSFFYKHFAQFEPDVIILPFCYSNNGDLANLLRRTATLSKMVITHDLRTITNNPALKLDKKQEEIFGKTGNGCLQV